MNKSPLARARDNFLKSDEGLKYCDTATLKTTSDQRQYLENRIVSAFLAGVKSADKLAYNPVYTKDKPTKPGLYYFKGKISTGYSGFLILEVFPQGVPEIHNGWTCCVWDPFGYTFLDWATGEWSPLPNHKEKTKRNKKLYTPIKVKAKHLLRERCNWVVYKNEHGKVRPTYYGSKKEAMINRLNISC